MDNKLASGLIAASIAIGGIGGTVITEPETISIGESRLVYQTVSEEIAVVKKAGDKELIKGSKRYDKNTGKEISPLIETVLVSQLQADIDGKENYLTALAARIVEIDALLAQEGDQIVKPQYDPNTGLRTDDLVISFDRVTAENEKLQINEAITEVTAQVAALNSLIAQANKIN